jgi:hypothetical protein
MWRFVAAIVVSAATCVAASDAGRRETSEGHVAVSFVTPKGWAGAKCTPTKCEFYPGKTFKNVGLAIGFTDLRPEDFTQLPENDRWVFEQDSLAEQYLKRERDEGSDQSGITFEPALGTPERRIRVYLSVSNQARFLSFIPRAGHVVEVCMFGNSVTDLATHKQTYLRFLDSLHVRPNQSMKPTPKAFASRLAPLRNKSRVFATTSWISSRCPATLVRLKLVRCSHSLAPTLVVLPSMSLGPPLHSLGSHTPAVTLFNASRGLSLLS